MDLLSQKNHEVMRAKRQVGELEGKINATRNKYLQDARAEATKVSEDLASNRYKLDERQSILGKGWDFE